MKEKRENLLTARAYFGTRKIETTLAGREPPASPIITTKGHRGKDRSDPCQMGEALVLSYTRTARP